MIKRSVQRELIRNNLAHRTDHPTADMVYQSIREELPNISLGTVYRNLRFLVDQGDALSLKLGDGKEHFDGNVNPHFHFICTQCGCVDDISCRQLTKSVLLLLSTIVVTSKDTVLISTVLALSAKPNTKCIL